MVGEAWIEKITIGKATLYLGDANAIAPAIGPVDVICTDPPYEFNSSGGGKFRKNRKYMNEIHKSGFSDGFDHNIIQKDRCNGAVVFVHEDQRMKVEAHLRSLFDRVCLCLWHKTNPSPMANKHFLADIEQYLVAWNKGFHPLGDYHDKSRVYTSSRGKRNFNHPTEKPLDLMRKIATNINGEIVLDPFMGTGTTLVACLERGMKVVGIEQDPKHFETAVFRIEEMGRAQVG